MQTTLDNQEVMTHNEIVYLAVKPDIMPMILEEIRDVTTLNSLLVSVAAGITTATMEKVNTLVQTD